MDKIGDQAFRADGNSERWIEMTYGGALSYLRRRYSRDYAGCDVVVSGVPYDCAVTYRPGARLGPRAVREASVQLAELSSFPYGFDPLAELAIVDGGDCRIDPHFPDQVAGAIEAHAAEILASGARALTFGGDHFVAYPLLRAHAAKHGPIALVQFDAHCDTWEDDGARMDHGTMFARAVAEGVVDPARSVQVGLRTYNDSDHGFEILSAPWVHRNGIDATIEAVRARVGDAPVYISFDVDGMDPAYAPGTGTPVVGGLASWQALEFIRGLKGLQLVGMDVVEVSPPYDHAEITALAAATVGYEWLCLLALEKGAVPKPVGQL